MEMGPIRLLTAPDRSCFTFNKYAFQSMCCPAAAGDRTNRQRRDKRLSQRLHGIETVRLAGADIQDRVEPRQLEKLDQMVSYVEHDDVAVILGNLAVDAD